MLFSNITILDENLDVQENMYVKVEDKKITYIGSERPEGDAGREYDGRGKLLMSGFFNGHAHSTMTLLRGYAENMNLQDWLFTKVFPYEDHLSSERVYAGTALSLAESLSFGIVSTSDMYFFCEDMVRAYIDSKSKGNICRSVSIMDDVPLLDTAPGKESKEWFEKYNGCSEGRIKMDMSIHSEYTNCDRTVIELAALTEELGTGMQVHVSETKKEVEECKERHGKTPVKYLADFGAFDCRTIAAHCVWMEEEDYKILKDKNVFVATNPVSNLKLASGVCNIPRMLEEGINLSIGTDGVSSNNNLDMFEEMKVFATAPKMYYNMPAAITAKETLRAATIGGALAQGREDTGLMKEGYKADLMVLDLAGPHMHPIHSLTDNLVYSASGRDVLMTMVDGEVLYENGEYKTIDIEKAIYDCERANADILAEL